MKIVIAAAALLLALSGTAGAMTFDATNTVPDTPGGQRFDQDFGVDYAKQVLSEASSFIWTTFNQPNPEDRSPYDSVTLTVVDDIAYAGVTMLNAIKLGAQHVASVQGDAAAVK